MAGAWLRLVVNSALVAAVAVAAQLGAGDQLGLIRWEGPHDTAAWTTLLTWVAFSYAVAVLGGSMVGRISMRDQAASRRGGIGSGVTASLVAAAGAAATIGLAWLPARGLVPPTNDNPGLVVSLTAGAGVVVGLLLSLLALAARPVSAGLHATVAALWLIGIGSAAAGLATHEPYAAPRLGVLDAPSLVPASEWTGPRAMIIAAAATGLLVSGVARLRGATRLGAALGGFGGPALVAAAYVIAGPQAQVGAPVDQPYLAALFATAAGLLASVLVALPGRRAARPARPAPVQAMPARPAPVQAAPARPAPVQPMPGQSMPGQPAPVQPAFTRPTAAPSAAAQPAPAWAAPVAEPAPLTGDVLEVVRGTASTTSSQGPARPAWAQGSGPYASAARAAATQPVVAAPPVRATGTAAVPTYTGTASVPTARPTSWEGGTMGQPPFVASVYDPPTGRHAAPE